MMKNILYIVPGFFAICSTLAETNECIFHQADNISITGNTITKSAGGSGWNAGTIGTRQIRSGDGYVEWTVTDITGEFAAGLSGRDSDADWTDVDLVIYQKRDDFECYSYGENITRTVGTVTNGAVLRVELDSTNVLFKLDGTTVETAYNAATNHPYLVDCSIKEEGGIISNVLISSDSSAWVYYEPVGWENPNGAVISGNRVTKNTDTTEWDSGAHSTKAITNGTGYLEYYMNARVDETAMLGFSSLDLDGTLTDFVYSVSSGFDEVFAFTSTGQILNSTNQPLSEGGYVRLEVDAPNSNVVISVNGTNLFTYTNQNIGAHLAVDCSIYNEGDGVGDVFIASYDSPLGFDTNVTPVIWTGLYQVSPTNNHLYKSSTNDAWDAGANSTLAIGSGDGFVEWLTHSDVISYTIGLSFENPQTSLSNAQYYSYEHIDLALWADTTNLHVMNGASNLFTGSGVLSTSDTVRIEVSGTNIFYRLNGTNIFTNSPSFTYPLFADSSLYSASGAVVSNVVLSATNMVAVEKDVVWEARTNAFSFNNQIYKYESDFDWNAGGRTTEAITNGDGYIQWEAQWPGDVIVDSSGLFVDSGYGTAGLSNGDTNQGLTDIDFAIQCNTGTLAVLDNGVEQLVLTNVVERGDILRIEINQGVVMALHNGVEIHRFSETNINYPLIGDSSLYAAGDELNDVRLGSFEAVIEDNGL